MEWSEHGIVTGVRRHGETDVILEVLTADHGRHLGLVKGGRSRRIRPILQGGNTLSLTWAGPAARSTSAISAPSRSSNGARR